MGLFSRITSMLHQPVRPAVAHAPAPAVAMAAVLPALKPGPGIADEASSAEFQRFLSDRRTSSANLTGLYNVATGQIVLGYCSHNELAKVKHLEMTERPPRLLPGWFGFRFQTNLQSGALNISPESGVYGGIPQEHLAGFRGAMETLFTGEHLGNATYERESELARLMRQRMAQPPTEPDRPVSNRLGTILKLSALVSDAENEPDFHREIARALVAHCIARLDAGDNIGEVIAQLKSSRAVKFHCYRDTLDVVMAYLLVEAQLVPQLCDRKAISEIFGIN